MAGGCQRQHCPCRLCCCRCCLHLRLRLRLRLHLRLRLRLRLRLPLRLRLCFCLPPAGCLHARLCKSRRHSSVSKGASAMHNGLLRAPRITIVARGREGVGGEDNLEPPTLRFGRRPLCPPSLPAATIVALLTPLSSSVIAVTIFLSLGCNATMRCLAGEEGSAPASAPVSPVEGTSLPLPQRLWRRHQVIITVVTGGQKISPPPLAANQRTLRRQQRWWRCQHGGEGGEPC